MILLYSHVAYWLIQPLSYIRYLLRKLQSIALPSPSDGSPFSSQGLMSGWHLATRAVAPLRVEWWGQSMRVGVAGILGIGFPIDRSCASEKNQTTLNHSPNSKETFIDLKTIIALNEEPGKPVIEPVTTDIKKMYADDMDEGSTTHWRRWRSR